MRLSKIYQPDIVAIIRAKARKFRRGDVVTHEDRPGVIGVVVHGGMGIMVVFQHGGRGLGTGLLFNLSHIAPRRNIPVPKGAIGHRWWNRQQAVTAALRRAGIEVGR